MELKKDAEGPDEVTVEPPESWGEPDFERRFSINISP
jgi:hypothetical protein